MPSEKPLCSGLIDRIGLENASVSHNNYFKGEVKKFRYLANLPDHEAGLGEVAKLLMDKDKGIISDSEEIEIVGHRVVHGGESFSATMVINEEVKSEINRLFSLAPLHNPSNFKGIEVAEKIFARARQVAVFDTAFHQTIPEKAFRYAIPDSFYTQEGIRAYGFHGTSHKYVSEKAAKFLNNTDAKVITIHLGNGCSMAAVKNGESIDTAWVLGQIVVW